MKTRTAQIDPRAPAVAVAAALVASLAAAAVARAAEVTAVEPLKATRFVSIGLTGSDALSVATRRCVDRIEARAANAVVACRLAVRRARAETFDPLVSSFAAHKGRRDHAFALGNLAVAQQLAGDLATAQATAAQALEFAPDEPLLVSNLAALESRRLAASTTAGHVK